MSIINKVVLLHAELQSTSLRYSDFSSEGLLRSKQRD